uniref:uncharacterized protein LOC105351905 n=1 Tax=Fragaria vesca subsp. vesca TaxID=101020 RepID=UPI0005CA76D5|nr:PREDICTED: uncharacterized protein LOC105351905 [Fragaria vesca subsp. vesca]
MTQHMNNIVDALIGSSDFRSWVNIIMAANPLSLPLSTTVLMPKNVAVSRLPVVDPFLLPYHVVPQFLTFVDLRLFKNSSCLLTFLPEKFIVITKTLSPISPSMTPLSPSPTLLHSSTSGSTSIASLIPLTKPTSSIPTPMPASPISSTMTSSLRVYPGLDRRSPPHSQSL